MAVATRKNFRDKLDFEQRRQEGLKIREKYPDRIAVIVDRHPDAKDSEIGDIDKKKFLVPHDLNAAQFMLVIRKRIQLDSAKSMYLFVEESRAGKKSFILIKSSDSLSSIYNEHKDADGFLYITYRGEDTFG